MANKRIKALTAFSGSKAALLALELPLGEPVNEDKKITIANLVLLLGLASGETDVQTVTSGGDSIAFSSAHGSTIADYHLVITCRNAANDEVIGYNIDNQTINGFDITPLADARVEWTVIDK